MVRLSELSCKLIKNICIIAKHIVCYTAMRLTKERKILIAVLAIGFGALGVDRFILSESTTTPQIASASVQGSVVQQAQSNANSAQVVNKNGKQNNALLGSLDRVSASTLVAERLRTISEQEMQLLQTDRNAFEPAGSWVQRVEKQQQQIETQGLSEADFVSKYTLTALLETDDSGIAIVNGYPVRVGESIERYRLLSVSGDQAIFASKNGKVTLTIMNK
ncbi:hypothetical protein [Poriferisphaera sp. WC338]|uniref:hypothetical protein n=1 Tax=Poriferisphaera sp. WC338 TaxID=3425129 RepID=UPI003D8182AB